jgi:hypothetical protein
MKNRKSQIAFAAWLAGGLPLGCTNEQSRAVSHPEPTTSIPSAVPHGDDTGANPKNDVDNHPEHMAPTPPGTPPEDRRIPEEVAPSK